MKKSNQIFKVLWAFVKIDLIAWGIYVASSILIQLILYSDVPPGDRNFAPVYWCMHIIYFIAYTLIFTDKINNDKIENTNIGFSLKQAIMEFLHKDRIQIVFMFIFAVVYEVSCWLLDGYRNPIGLIIVMFVPSAATIDIPVIRTCVGLTISLFSMLLSNIVIKYKKNKYWNG